MARTRLAEALVQLQADLLDIGARWALIGGLAVSGRTEPRTTRDIDVAVARTMISGSLLAVSMSEAHRAMGR